MSDWEKSVIAAVREVISHPFGGRVEVFVNAKELPGQFGVKPVVYLNGKRKPETVVTIAD
jgi:hypothetical protein